MLSRLRLRDFKSFADQTVHLSPLTVLVGANASGKSNLLDAMRFLQGIAMDMSIADALRGRWEGGRKTWPGLRGGTADVVRKGRQDFQVQSMWMLDGETMIHTIGCAVGDQPRVILESLTNPSAASSLFEAVEGPDEQLFVQLNGRLAHHLASEEPHARSLLSAVGRTSPIRPACERLTSAMRSMYFLDITPSRMRDYAPMGAEFIGLEGENVSALAWRLCHESEATRRDLVDWLTELCAPELIDIDFVKTDLGDVMMVLVEQGGHRIPARSMSDGTLRFFGELIALRTAAPGSILLMEEIENGLHPTRAHLLVEAMEAATRARGVQVIATTHSPLVLNALSPDALRQAVLVARPPGSTSTEVRALGDLPDFEEVVKRRGVDRLLSSGWLERAL